MRVVLGADHAGYDLKADLLEEVRRLGHEVTDVGTHNTASVDYPDYARAVATEVVQGRADRGILICGSGVGASVAVNKLRGLRGGLCHDTYSARQGVEHDDMNVLVLGARVIGPKLALELVSAFLRAKFRGAERHRRRLSKIAELENSGAAIQKEERN
jgi:ribose 5-phosphate isomerase B